MRITEPISQGLIQPFINQMLEDLKVTPDRTQVGYYAGLITSLFAFSQLCTTFWWGMLSDRVGRKPILLCGLTGLSISIISFGLQTSFVGLVVARCFAGVMNGNVAVVKSVLAEITDDTNKARAFALLPMCAAIGTIIGPMIGGYLALPAEQYPSLFGNIPFLRAYPYFLPCFIAGLTNLLAVVLGFFYLEETLKFKNPVTIVPQEATEEDGLMQAEDSESGQEPELKPKLSALFTPTVVSVLLGSLFVYVQTSAWATLIPMFAYTRVEDGGLGLNLNQIGTALSTTGLVSVFVQMVVFPYSQKRWGTLKVFKTFLLIWPIAFGLLPLVRLVMVRERELHGAEQGSKVALAALILVLAFRSFGGITMVCVSLLINAAAPSPSTFGALNGLGQSCSALARTVAPSATGALFALSIDQKYLGGNLIWVGTIAISVIAWLSAQTIRPTSERLMIRGRTINKATNVL